MYFLPPVTQYFQCCAWDDANHQCQSDSWSCIQNLQIETYMNHEIWQLFILLLHLNWPPLILLTAHDLTSFDLGDCRSCGIGKSAAKERCPEEFGYSPWSQIWSVNCLLWWLCSSIMLFQNFILKASCQPLGNDHIVQDCKKLRMVN